MSNSKADKRWRRAACLAAALLLTSGSSLAAKLDPGLLTKAKQTAPADVLLIFPAQATPMLAPLDKDATPLVRRRALVATLQSHASRQQAATRAWLDARGIAHRDFWIVNAIATSLYPEEIRALGERQDLARIAADPMIAGSEPEPSTSRMRSLGTLPPWGIQKIRAPLAWAAGVTGQGVVVAGADTGYDWDHPALKPAYRGWNGSNADHNYNWHDAIHVANASCPADSPAPCDDKSHGTHTMGTMLGVQPGVRTIGVAPDARWIGCRNMDEGFGSPSSYIECMQWLLYPTDLAGNNADPAMAPDVINNSWGCVPLEGCTVGDEIQGAVQNLIAGGVFYVVSAGNAGSACNTIGDPPAIYSDTFSVAASDINDAIAGFSSRGPVPGAPGVTLDIGAPGVQVYSSIPPDEYGLKSGTSMAGPHVAGVAALIMSVNPELQGHPQQVADILRASADRTGITDPNNSGCGGLDMNDWPNWQAGYGRLDAWAAVVLADTLFADDFDN